LEVRRLPIPVIIDTDPGIDDALAIALAMRSPEVTVLALTTVYGNGEVRVTTRNARHLLERLGVKDVPVFAGAARPLVRPPAVAVETHGEEGLGYAPVPGAGTRGEGGGTTGVEAPGALLRVLASAGEPVTVLALGPLTNLALALALDRELCCRMIREIMWMGGSAGAPGNTTPVSEFNAWCDPEAARAVLDSPVPVRMVGLDATRCVFMPAALVGRMAAHPDAEIRWWAEMWRFYVDFHRRSEGLDGCIMNDPLAVGLLVRPDLGRWAPWYVEVGCGLGVTRGQTDRDRCGFPGPPAGARVHPGADGEGALALALERALGVKL